MKYVIALDQGTTSSRAIVFDHGGGIIAVAQREFEQIFPQPGWVEHDAEEIWTSQIGVVAEAMKKAGLTAADLAGIGITNQRETAVIWDRKSGKPIHNAIVWQDRRTAGAIDRIKADGSEPMIRERSGLVADAYFSGSKVGWLLDNVAGARDRARSGELAFGTIDCWLLNRLTGGATHVTDVSNASRTMLYDIHRHDWDDDLLALFDVPRAILPEVRGSSEVYAEATVEPLAGVPIAGIAGDQQAALFGQLCVAPGMSKNTYGTGCFTLMNTGERAVTSSNKLITTIAWRIGDRTEYAMEGSVFIGGAVVQWLRDGLKVIQESPDVEQLAGTVKDNGGVYFVPAFAGLGAPHWDQYARGAICGLTRGSTVGHIARAALESIAYQVADLLDAMRDDASIDLAELRVDGGAAANDGLLQFQSDILQTPLVRPTVTETTALGAAYLAGLATGYWSSTEDLQGNWQMDRRFEPVMKASDAAAFRARWNAAVERAKGWETQK